MKDDSLARRMIDAVPSLMAYLDPAGHILLANAAFAAWLGRVPETGTSVVAALGTTARELAARVSVAFSDGTQEWQGEIVGAAGRRRRVSAQIIPDYDDVGEPRGLVLIALGLPA